MNSRIKDLWVFVGIQAVAITNFLIFGLNHVRSWKDASQYSAYASNLILGNGYSVDGIAFSAWREPGYPFFVATIYKIFGNENLLAVCFVQAVLLGVLGFIIYKTFAEFGKWKYGVLAAVCVSGLPFYGFYSNEILSEFLFAFFLGLVFYVCARIMRLRGAVSWHWYAVLGLVCGYVSLVRFQFVFFLPIILIFFLIVLRPHPLHVFRNMGISLIIAAAILGSWASYVHKNTGVFAVAAGRQQEMLSIRAARAQLSYRDLTQYLHDWMYRSISGGEGTKLLYDNEFKNLYRLYNLQATTTESATRVKNENIAIVLSHPGHFLYGSFIEAIKLAYIEHDYSDSVNRYVRAGMYVALYAFFLFGLVQLFLGGNREIRSLGVLALIMIAYNFLVLTMLDTIPRYNTPYLFLYITIGFCGVVLWRIRRARA